MGTPDNQKFRHHWDKVIHKFSKVVERYPESPQAYKAVFTMDRLYEGMKGIYNHVKDLDQALRYYIIVSLDFSPGTLTDDAMFEAAKIYRDKKDFSSAASILKMIFEKYPNAHECHQGCQFFYQKIFYEDIDLYFLID